MSADIDYDLYNCDCDKCFKDENECNHNDLRNRFVLQLKDGDKMDVYDEEMKYWEVATIQCINPSTKHITFTFDEDDIDYLWECHINDVDLAPFKTYTLQYTQLALPNGIYVDNNLAINRYFDHNNKENIIIDTRSMTRNDQATETMQTMRYNVTTNKLYPLNYKTDTNSNIINETCNELHLIKHDLSSKQLLYNGKWLYVSATNQLMYFGGSDIWYYDLNEKKWRLYSLKLPRSNNTDFTVCSAGELIFIFYYDCGRDIYIYNLSDKRAYKSVKKYPSQYEGKSVGIKTCNGYIHFINATKSIKQLKVKHRPYHFKIDLKDIIPKRIQNDLNKRYNKLIYQYIQNNINNSTLSFCLRALIQQYFPLFL